MRLIADIGGTNARFAIAAPGGGVSDAVVLPVAAHRDFGDALAAYLRETGASPADAAIAAAGPRDGGTVRLTNAPWVIEAGAVSRQLGGVPVRVLNDLEAVALFLPVLGSGDVEMLSGERRPGDAPGGRLPLLAANVGTGFGAAVAVPAPGGWVALGTEAGHMSLVPATPSEEALLRPARSVEDAFSGPGYARLLGGRVSDGGESRHPVRDEAGGESRTLYSRAFGRLIGDLVLATGSWGGVYLCGGVVSDFHRIVELEPFLSAFRRKGKMAERMQGVPVGRIVAEAPAFRALASADIPAVMP